MVTKANEDHDDNCLKDCSGHPNLHQQGFLFDNPDQKADIEEQFEGVIDCDADQKRMAPRHTGNKYIVAKTNGGANDEKDCQNLRRLQIGHTEAELFNHGDVSLFRS